MPADVRRRDFPSLLCQPRVSRRRSR